MTPYYSDSAVTIYHGDCREILPDLPKVDLVLTDPPYGIGVGKMSMGAGKKSTAFSGFDWDNSPPTRETLSMVVACGERAVVWGGNYFDFPQSKAWLCWDKMQRFDGAEAELAWTNYDIPIRCIRLSRVEAYGSVSRLHPTQKPIRVIKWCIELCPDNPQTILDPFMGSGTTLRAAKDLGRKAIGIEIEEKYCEIAAQRMAQEVLDL